MKTVPITPEERAKYDEPLSENEITRLILLTTAGLRKRKNEAGLIRDRILLMKLNDMLRPEATIEGAAQKKYIDYLEQTVKNLSSCLSDDDREEGEEDLMTFEDFVDLEKKKRQKERA